PQNLSQSSGGPRHQQSPQLRCLIHIQPYALSVVIQRGNNYHQPMATLSTAFAAGDPPTSQPAAESAAASDAPVRRRSRRLAHQLVEGIGAQIQGQQLKPGDKLPTESEIMHSY